MKFLKVKSFVSKSLILTMMFFIYMAFSADLNAQNVAITDDDGYTVNAAAMLDVKSVNKGFLVPRVALVSTTDPISVTKPEGLLVWNTSTSSPYPDPGFYYWSGSDWVKVGSSALDFQNGLTQSGNSVKLGGALTESSTITQGAYSMNFNLSGTGDFNIQDAGTSAFFVRDDGNVGIGTTSPGQKFEVAGNIKLGDNIMLEGSAGYRVYRNLASYSATGSTVDGAFVINTGQSMSRGCMIRLKIEGYMYDENGPFEIIIGAWCYNTTFSRLGFINTGSQKLDVRLAKNISTGNLAIILGNETYNYPYPKLTVTEFMQGHSVRKDSDADGWTITQETDISGYTPIEDVPDVTNMDNRYYTETEVDNFLSGENLWDGSSGNLYPHTISDNVGIGTPTPGSRLEVYGNQSGSDNDPLFEVKNNTGQTIFAVYPEGVRIYVDEDVTSKGLKGGFAVGGFNSSKGITNEYLRITPDTFRIYVDDTGTKGLKGGFAVGGFGPSKGLTNEYFRITPDSVRIYVDNEPGTKGLKGGFAVGGFNSSKGYEEAISFMNLTPENYFIGHESGLKTSPGTTPSYIGRYNTFFGYQAGQDNTSGYSNIYIGYQAGHHTFSGYDNVYIGNNCGATGHGQYNVYIGHEAGMKNSGGSLNTFVGKSAGRETIAGDYNVFVGISSGQENLTGQYNLYLGGHSGMSNQGGEKNVYLGYDAGKSATTGTGNIFIGHQAGRDEDGDDKLYIDNWWTSSPLIYGDFNTNDVRITGDICWTGSGTACSDGRYKKDINIIYGALEKIKKINGVYYYWKTKEFSDMEFSEERQIGIIAQEIEKLFPELVKTDTKGYKSVNYSKITAILIEAVKEQQQVIEELESENVQFKNEIEKISDLQRQIDRLRNSLDMNKQ